MNFLASWTLGAAIGFLVGIVLFAAFMIICWIQIFKKAKEPAWKIAIPVYNCYCQFKVANTDRLFWITISSCLSFYIIHAFVMALVGKADAAANPAGFWTDIGLRVAFYALVFAFFCLFNIRLGRSFNRSSGFIIGLILLHPVFIALLAFGSAQFAGYRGGLDDMKPVTGIWTCEGCGSEVPQYRNSCPQCGHVH